MPSSKNNRPCISCKSRERVTISLAREGKFQVQEDGSLLFERIPQKDKVGYTRDPFNKYRLVPTHLPCAKRITQPVLQRTGVYTVMNQCNCPGHPLRGQEVTPDDCKACPLRVDKKPIDGTLEM